MQKLLQANENNLHHAGMFQFHRRPSAPSDVEGLTKYSGSQKQDAVLIDQSPAAADQVVDTAPGVSNGIGEGGRNSRSRSNKFQRLGRTSAPNEQSVVARVLLVFHNVNQSN